MTTAARGACSDPIDRAILMDYWLALLPSTVEQAVDLHLLGCDACSDRLRETIALSESLSHVARSGELPVIVSDAFVRHAIAAGRQVREYAAMPGESVPCTVSADDDYLVARLGADLRGAGRVDLSLDMRGSEVGRLADIPVHAETGQVICQMSIGWSKAAPDNSVLMRLLSVDEAGAERMLGEYAFHHTRTIPGPPGWTFP